MIVKQESIPPKLDEIAGDRDHISTKEFSDYISRAEQTVRKNYCLSGECFGIRPIKFGNRLLWPVVEIAALLNEGEKGPATKIIRPSDGEIK